MEKDHNLNSAENVLPLNAFPVQSRNREKGKMNDLEACEHRHLHFYSSTKNKKTNMRLSTDSSLVGRPQWGMSHFTTMDDNSRSSWLVLVTSSGSRWYGCACGKGAIVPKRGWPRRIWGQHFSLSRWIWTVLDGRRSKIYHQLHHAGILWFHGFCDFMSWMQENANENLTRMPTKKGENLGIFGTRDADLRKAVFQAI